jgi:peptidoglycan/xylan/chitin deacetylase (PgdA/CDA1 family)
VTILTGLLPYRAVSILMYHRIAITVPEEDPKRLSVPPERFAAHMKYLSDHGYATVGLDELSGSPDDGRSQAGNQVALTFDDGCLDNYEHALPVLQQYGFAATFFVVPGFVDRQQARGSREPVSFMSWSHCREIVRLGMHVQSHTLSHCDLTTLSEAALRAELLDSRMRLEDEVGLPVRHLAYPYGRYDERVRAMVSQSGYQAAYADRCTRRGPFSRERIPCLTLDTDREFQTNVSPWGHWRYRLRCLPGEIRHAAKRMLYGGS